MLLSERELLNQLDTGITYNTDQMSRLQEGQLYIALYHGRNSPNEDLSDWGENGPVLGPLRYCHTTYKYHLRICGIQAPDPVDVEIVKDMIHYKGMFYGDWTIFIHRKQ